MCRMFLFQHLTLGLVHLRKSDSIKTFSDGLQSNAAISFSTRNLKQKLHKLDLRPLEEFDRIFGDIFTNLLDSFLHRFIFKPTLDNGSFNRNHVTDIHVRKVSSLEKDRV